jgi:hypothetical protein
MCDHGNGLDESAVKMHPTWDKPERFGPAFPCDDGHPELAPVGSFTPNPWGSTTSTGTSGSGYGD